ncbi:lipase family protein, partial [Aliarcobacter butzleri]
DRQIDFLSDIEFINNNYELFLCGHSLGGAIATIVGCYFYDEGINKKNLSIFTFGAPPIAKKEFCDYYENSFKIFRFVNKEDPVPNITKFTKLKHIGKTILLNTKEVNFHSLKDYEKILKNL